MATQLSDASLTSRGPLLNKNPAIEPLSGDPTGTGEWRSPVVNQPSGDPPLPLYAPAMGGIQGGGGIWGPGGESSGASNMSDVTGTAKNGSELLLKRENSNGSRLSSLAGTEPPPKRYRPDGRESPLPEGASWGPAPPLAAFPAGGRSAINKALTGPQIVQQGSCSGMGFGGLGQGSVAPMEFPQGAATEASAAVSLSSGASQVLSPEASGTLLMSCSGDTSGPLPSLQGPLGFQEMQGAGGAASTMPTPFPASGAMGPTGMLYSAPSPFSPTDTQLSLQQQQALRPGQPPLEGYLVGCPSDVPYATRPPTPGVQTPGMRTPTTSSTVSSSRRSRCGSSGSSRKGQTGGVSGRSGNGSGGHGQRTIGRIYSLLVRGVRCWRAEWHDRSSGHRKTRQYAAPKHGEQQARALCLQALCQARSVPAQLLREAQQTFAYEPNLSPENNSEPEDPPAEQAVPRGASYASQPQLQQPPHGQLLQPASIEEPTGHLVQPQFQRGEASTSNGGFAQQGYFWPGTGRPPNSSFGSLPSMLDTSDQQTYGTSAEPVGQPQQQQQTGFFLGGLGLPMETPAAGIPIEEAPSGPHANPNAPSVFPPDSSNPGAVAAPFGNNAFTAGGNAEHPAVCSASPFDARSAQEGLTAKQELPESAMNSLPLVCAARAVGVDPNNPTSLSPPQQCAFPAAATTSAGALMTKEEPANCADPDSPEATARAEGDRANAWNPSFLAA